MSEPAVELVPEQEEEPVPQVPVALSAPTLTELTGADLVGHTIRFEAVFYSPFAPP